jgi:hypothetical protein
VCHTAPPPYLRDPAGKVAKSGWPQRGDCTELGRHATDSDLEPKRTICVEHNAAHHRCSTVLLL